MRLPQALMLASRLRLEDRMKQDMKADSLLTHESIEGIKSGI